eukprot:SAG31_NODE_3783_length_3883_cov_2.045983_1_plen_172_part_00
MHLRGGTLPRLAPDFLVRAWEIQREKFHKKSRESKQSLPTRPGGSCAAGSGPSPRLSAGSSPSAPSATEPGRRRGGATAGPQQPPQPGADGEERPFPAPTFSPRPFNVAQIFAPRQCQRQRGCQLAQLQHARAHCFFFKKAWFVPNKFIHTRAVYLNLVNLVFPRPEVNTE